VSSIHDFYQMGAEYGIPGFAVDGMDVLKVYEMTTDAVRRAREEKIPTLLEVKTYRYRGHSMSDPGQYRTKEELETQKKQDPILILKNRMTSQNMLSESQYAEMDEQARRLVEEAAKFAEESPSPSISTLYADVTI